MIRNIIYLNIVVAVSTGVLAAGYTYHAGIENWSIYGAFTFFATLSVYNGQRIFKSDTSLKTPWLSWVQTHKKWIYFIVILGAASSFYCLMVIGHITYNAMLLLASSSLVSVFYVLKINGRNLREIPFVKIHLIALSWTAIIILFPVLNEGVHQPIIWIGMAYYFYVLGVTIPFDIRDLKYDQASQKTIPQLFGTNGAKLIALFSVLTFSVMMLYVDHTFWRNPLFYMAVGVQLLLIIMMDEDRSDLYCAGWIDGAIALLGLSYFY